MVLTTGVTIQVPLVGFPADAIYQYLSSRGIFVFTEESIETVVRETSYGDGLAFAVLALLFPNLNYQHSLFHIDHMHPQAYFTRQKLASAGVPSSDIESVMECRDRLPNLHLIPGPDNLSKNDAPLAEWLSEQSKSGQFKSELWKSLSLIPDTDLSLANFHAFYEARRQLLTRALKEKLGVLAHGMTSNDALVIEAPIIHEVI